MKYAVLFIALLFAGCGGGSSTVGYEIEIDGGTLQVAKEDFPSKMDYLEAMEACAGLGNGWRAPEYKELEIMYIQLHEKGKGNFKNGFYWSGHRGREYAVSSNFISGGGEMVDKSTRLYVRAVRVLPFKGGTDQDQYESAAEQIRQIWESDTTAAPAQ
jgi:hypothetical protein